MMNQVSRAFSARAGVLVVLALLAGGCQWKQPEQLPRRNLNSSNAVTIQMPPKELVKLIEQKLPQPPMSIPVESTHHGIVFTDWKEYEGAIHIVRRWRERTRFQINVFPDFDDPLSTSHVEVFDETEEKPSDPQPWYPNADLRRSERSAEVLKMIVDLAKPAAKSN